MRRLFVGTLLPQRRSGRVVGTALEAELSLQIVTAWLRMNPLRDRGECRDRQPPSDTCLAGGPAVLHVHAHSSRGEGTEPRLLGSVPGRGDWTAARSLHRPGVHGPAGRGMHRPEQYQQERYEETRHAGGVRTPPAVRVAARN